MNKFLRRRIQFYDEELKKIFLYVSIGALTVLFFSTLHHMHDIGAISSFIETVQEIFPDLADETGHIPVYAYWENNLIAMGGIALSGLVPFLFLPILSLFFNVKLIGGLVGMFIFAKGGRGLLLALAGLLVHGIFEIPALLLSATLGIRLSLFVTRKLMGKPEVWTFRELLAESVLYLLTVIVPLVLVAGILEAYATPVVLDWAMEMF